MAPVDIVHLYLSEVPTDLATVHHGKQVVEHGNIAMVRESEIADYPLTALLA